MAYGAHGGFGPATDASAAQGSWLPDQRSHQDSLDGLRFIAAFTIVQFHVAFACLLAATHTFAGRLTGHGDVAVPVFFALSGLLLYRPWAAATVTGTKAPAAGAYLWRRAVRILPAYWVLVVVCILCYGGRHAHELSTWVYSMTLSCIYPLHPWWPLGGPQGITQAWSLDVEASFYLVLPLLGAGIAWLATRGRGRVDVRIRVNRMLWILVCLAVVSIPYIWWVEEHLLSYAYLLWLPRSLAWFAGGMFLAVIASYARIADGPWRRRARAIAMHPFRTWAACLIVYGIACLTPDDQVSPGLGKQEWTYAYTTVLYLAIAMLLLAPAAFQPAHYGPVNAVLGNRVMRYLGKLSYGVFLWQFVIIKLLVDPSPRPMWTWHYLNLLLATTAGTIILAALSYHLIEQPSQRLRHLFDRRPKPATPLDEPGHAPAANAPARTFALPAGAPLALPAGTPIARLEAPLTAGPEPEQPPTAESFRQDPEDPVAAADSVTNSDSAQGWSWSAAREEQHCSRVAEKG